MKKLVATFIILLSLFALCAEDSKKEDKTFYQLDTKYFQIIYQQKSLETATLLYENADQLYEDIAKKLNTETNLSIPVLIRSDIQALNAYFTSYPYNRIVLYDTIPDGQSLAVFSDTILSVFYHELVHAVTLNMKNKTWRFIGNIFGDFLSPTIISSPTVFSEGATVSFESATGEGRLNSGYAKNILVQAKLENNLPDWKEASGANDKYRVGDYPYIFGGAFHQFLQEKYGMEKYSELWKTLASKATLTETTFKKVYGKKLKVVWTEFLDTIPLLPVVEGNQTNLTKKDNITCFTTVNNTTIYYSNNDNAIYSLKNGKQKKILTSTSVEDLSLSDDERFLAITKLSSEMQYETIIFDMQKKLFLEGSISGFRLPFFSTYDDKLLLIGLTSSQSKSSIQYYEIDEKTVLKDSILSKEEFDDDIWLKFSDIEVFTITKSKNQDKITVLAKENLNWFIGTIPLENLQKSNYDLDYYFFENAYKLPENIQPLSLSYVSENEYLISYVEKDYSLPRVAKIVDGKISYQQKDISGGIQNPVKIGDNYIFLNQMLTYNTISSIENIPLDFSSPVDLENYSDTGNINFYHSVEKIQQLENLVTFGKSETDSDSFINPLDDKYQNALENSKKFSDADFIDKTVFIPLISNFDMTGKNLLTVKSATSLPGFTLFWQSPVETPVIGFGVGYSKDLMNAHFSFAIEDLFSMVISGVLDNDDKKGLKYSETDISFNFNVDFPLSIYDLTWNLSYDLLYNIPTSLEWTKVSRIGFSLTGIYGGFGASLLFQRDYFENFLYLSGYNAMVKIPRLLPFDSPYGFTLNLPLNVSAYLCPDFQSFFLGDAELTLFSAEIHKSVPLVPFYTNRFSVTSSYFYDFRYKTSYENYINEDFIEIFSDLNNKTDLVHGITASAFFELTPVIGNLVNLRTRLGVDFTYYFDSEKLNKNKPYEITIAGMFTF